MCDQLQPYLKIISFSDYEYNITSKNEIASLSPSLPHRHHHTLPSQAIGPPPLPRAYEGGIINLLLQIKYS